MSHGNHKVLLKLRHDTTQAIRNSEIEGLSVTPEQAERAYEEVLRMVTSGGKEALALRMARAGTQIEADPQGSR